MLKVIGVCGSENGNFPLHYLMKMFLHRGWVRISLQRRLTLGWVVLKSLQTPLRNIKMVT